MSATICPVTPEFAAEVGDVDLGNLTDTDLDAIKRAFWKHAVLIFRCTMHRGTDYDDLRWVRDMRRTTVSDIANTCEQAGISIPA